MAGLNYNFNLHDPIPNALFVQKIANLIELCEALALEVENASAPEATIDVKLLTGMVLASLVSSIDGSSTHKLTNMVDASSPQDYVTLSALNTLSSGIRDVDDPAWNISYDPAAQLVARDSAVGFFTYAPSPNFSYSATHLIPQELNACFYLDFSVTTQLSVQFLDLVLPPTLGDFIYIYLYNPGNLVDLSTAHIVSDTYPVMGNIDGCYYPVFDQGFLSLKLEFIDATTGWYIHGN
jgi:hypothetical protein